ncbi:MAG: hypothetical protein IJ459_02225 [Clostridia bacterium]|nr:hypothetical protein [Clostridia bacterium]
MKIRNYNKAVDDEIAKTARENVPRKTVRKLSSLKSSSEASQIITTVIISLIRAVILPYILINIIFDYGIALYTEKASMYGEMYGETLVASSLWVVVALILVSAVGIGMGISEDEKPSAVVSAIATVAFILLMIHLCNTPELSIIFPYGVFIDILYITFLPLILLASSLLNLILGIFDAASLDSALHLFLALLVWAVYLVLFGLNYCIIFGEIGIDLTIAEKCPWVSSKFRKLEKVQKQYDEEYKICYEEAAELYANSYKEDTFADILASCPIPNPLKTINMVSSLIWCIENGYARDIVGARNWYLQQERNQAMMDKLQGIAEENRRQAEEAARFRERVVRQMERDSEAMQKASDEIASGVRDIASSNEKILKEARDISYAADKTARNIDSIHLDLS